MTLHKHLSATAVALAALGAIIPAAQAQSGTVTVTSSGGTYQFQTTYNVTAPTVSGGQYTYNYTTTLLPTTGSPLNNVSLLTFSFSGTPTFSSATPSSFGPPINPAVNSPSNGYFVFLSFPGLTTASPTASFSFMAPQGPGGTLGLTSSSNGGDASVTTGLPGPLAAPEPGSLVSMAVLGTCLGLGVVARRRKMLVN